MMFRNLHRGWTHLRSAASSNSCSVTTPLFRHTRTFIRLIISTFSGPWNRAHLERGFSEIAQNLTTFPDGTVAVCRSIDTVPAGIKGANRNGICVENVGNFDGLDSMTPQHRDCIIKVFALLCKRFNLSPDSNSCVYHHWYDLNTRVRSNGTGTTKTCPGTLFFSGNTVAAAEANFIPLIKQQLAAYAATSGGQPPAQQAGPVHGGSGHGHAERARSTDYECHDQQAIESRRRRQHI